MHITKIVRTEQQSDEAIAVIVRCCDNPKTDSALTIYGAHKMTSKQIDDYVEKHHDRVCAKCDAMKKANAHLATIATQRKEHK